MIKRLLIFWMLFAGCSWATNYKTSFPNTETPISEGGKWTNGSAAGTSAGTCNGHPCYIWANANTTPGKAFGTEQLDTTQGQSYRDGTALVTGISWAADQCVQATVFTTGSTPPVGGSYWPEVELRLRSAISANTNRGYEIDFGVDTSGVSGSAYAAVVRWNGAYNSFNYINPGGGNVSGSQYGVKNGDVLRACMIGTTIQVWKNGTLLSALTSTDATFASGTPGMGFNAEYASTYDNTYGFSNFAASNVYTAVTCNQSDVNAVINGPTHTAVDGDIIQIPAGSCTWSSGVTVPSNIGITIQGNGTPNSTPGTNGASASCSNTTITVGTTGTFTAFTMSPQYGNSTSRISCIKMLPSGSTGSYAAISINGVCAAGGCPNFRLDNITAPSSWGSISVSDQMFASVANVFGVADHNTVGDASDPGNYIAFINVGHGSWLGVGAYGDNDWASPLTFGTNQAFYIENNVLRYTQATDTDIPSSSSGGGGGRFVCRFNSVPVIEAYGLCTGHGTDTGGRIRGGHQIETYYNTGVCTGTSLSQGCGSLTIGRSGVQITFGNTITNQAPGFFKGIGNFNSQRRWRTDSWGPCDGTSVWDTNDGTTYFSGTLGNAQTTTFPDNSTGYILTDSGAPGWTTNQWVSNGNPYSVHDASANGGAEIIANTSNTLSVKVDDTTHGTVFAAGQGYQILRTTVCLDQANRTGGTLYSGNPATPSQAVSQTLSPSYEFMDSQPGTADHALVSGTLSIIANRDYYTESINQVAQTNSSTPFNGTSGVGHGVIGYRPASCTTGVGYWATNDGPYWNNGSGQGRLYVCISTNNWQVYYTPYTYPHPLIAGTGGGGTPPPPPPTAFTAIPGIY